MAASRGAEDCVFGNSLAGSVGLKGPDDTTEDCLDTVGTGILGSCFLPLFVNVLLIAPQSFKYIDYDQYFIR